MKIGYDDPDLADAHEKRIAEWERRGHIVGTVSSRIITYVILAVFVFAATVAAGFVASTLAWPFLLGWKLGFGG